MSAGQHPPLACRPSPPQGGRSLSSRLSPIAIVAGVEPTVDLPISPLAGEMPGRAEGGAVLPASGKVLHAPTLEGMA
ncbi:hypothetical protein EOA13_34565 [Mesorhizobium sp. M7A.F.Ca.US.011.01.1.1]|nr:hypothetical protein EOA13_34565 [Mesorhizobium sp. M7A.F.Ca.US.011.01.1.1]